MAKITVTERNIIVDDLFNRISQPIIEENEKKIKEYVFNEEELKVVKKIETYFVLEERIKKMRAEQDSLSNEIKKFTFMGYAKDKEDILDSFRNRQAQKKLILKKYPSTKQIQTQFIINSNKSIPEIIKTLLEEFKNFNK
jgi:hypothetical protein